MTTEQIREALGDGHFPFPHCTIQTHWYLIALKEFEYLNPNWNTIWH